MKGLAVFRVKEVKSAAAEEKEEISFCRKTVCIHVSSEVISTNSLEMEGGRSLRPKNGGGTVWR